ncbi:hypothetical protein ZOSMA_280G00030 [Zostera marina]|uniref:Bifunctional inhibitor/plant lipid transfer protein/seed storage helical domain-containing protein n=1 Tax=Zostera marina TaxID=29655 RepID=A0A0K9PFB3_ZOSMR|nr:hypothetical protein ZOSMA_280G00030 [Zostera marina]
MSQSVIMCVFLGVMLLLLFGAPSVQSGSCDISHFQACVPAVLHNAVPSRQCCNSLKGQQHCYCSFKGTTTFKKYITPSIEHKFSRVCHIRIPHC